MNRLSGTINVSDIYVSIQGEGKYLGYPAIFIRTSGCNLRCQWQDTLCDTPYTSWNAEISFKPITQIIDHVRRLKKGYSSIKKIVVTGGEPLIQKNIDTLTDELKNMGFFLSLETNGTITKPLTIDFVTLSPKLKSSVPTQSEHETKHETLRYRKEALSYWLNNYPYQIKFVINEEEDENEISGIIADLGIDDSESIYVMPQGVTRKELMHNSKKCVDISLRRGWKYTPRAHIEIYGNIRGK